MNLALIGYRGTGKSTVANLAAAQLGWRVVSTDARVVERAGRSIPDIVAREGWDHFRDLETAVCGELREQDHMVIDTGGGIILRPANIAAFKPHCLVCWLTATVETITLRIAEDTQRPALTAGHTFVEEIREVLTARAPKYRAAADHVMATDNRTPEEIAAEIVNIFDQHVANQSC